MKLLALLLFSQISFAGLIVVSDFDDTIKHTNVKDPKDVVINVLANRTAFTGMPELLNEMSVFADKTIILTGSPSLIRRQIKSLLRKNHIHFDQLITNRLIERKSTYHYKIETLTKLLNTYPDDQFIFLGDDGGKDPEIYDLIQKKFPTRVQKIYTHLVQGRSVPKSSITYITAADIALWEYHEQRLNLRGFKKILETVTKNKVFKKTIPSFAYCPKTIAPWSYYPNTELNEKVLIYQNEIIENCHR